MLDEWIAGGIGADVLLDRESLEAWQLQKLNSIIKRAADNSPFYERRLKGVQISSLDEFARIPFTTPEDLRKDGTAFLTVPASGIRRITTLSTSGSEGEPKRVYCSREDLLGTVEFFSHGLHEFVRQGDRVLLLLPGNNPDGLNDLISSALELLHCEGIYFGYPDENKYTELMDRIVNDGISYLIGTARTLAEAARFSESAGLAELFSGQIHGVLAAAAFVSDEDRNDVIRIWKCSFDEFYGMTETGFAGAVGCRVPGGYHVWEGGLYMEIVDPANGNPLPDGEEGEIVITTLTDRAMPFIRYRTGDISRFMPGKCACESCLKRLERVRDRADGKKYERH